MSADKDKDIQKIAKMMSKELGKIIETAKNPSEDANKPFRESSENAEKYGKLISRPKSKVDAKKKLVGFKTGTFLDDLFLNEDGNSLGGIPIVGQLGVVGLSGTGKSILMQEVALRVADSGKRVIFITSEEPFETSNLRNDLQSRLKQKADIMNLDWETIRENLFVMDAVKNSSLRNWFDLIQTLKYLVNLLNGIDLLIIDSLTLLESRYVLKWRVLELSRYCQLRAITTLYVCQRAEDKSDSLNVAGGINISHNLDGMICLDVKKAVGRIKSELNKKQWEETHFVRILACRLGAYNPRYFELEVSSDGFLRLKKEE